MYCLNCGTQLPDEANFCWKCGKPVKPVNTQDNQHENQVETCEIIFEERFSIPNNQFRFIAQAISPKGRYVAAVSSWWGQFNGPPDSRNKQAVANLDYLVRKLGEAGWQSIPNGTAWYNARFQRFKRKQSQIE
jgi:hypothetical protein